MIRNNSLIILSGFFGSIGGWLGVTLFILFWYAVMPALYGKHVFLRV